MITDLDRKILAKACGLCWHEMAYDEYDGHYFCQLCGDIPEWPHNCHHSFSTPDDWEMVLRMVVVESRRIFHDWIRDVDHPEDSGFEWWLTLTPEGRCQLVCNWIKSRPDLFPWVVDFIVRLQRRKCQLARHKSQAAKVCRGWRRNETRR